MKKGVHTEVIVLKCMYICEWRRYFKRYFKTGWGQIDCKWYYFDPYFAYLHEY